MSGAAKGAGVEQPVISTELVRQVKRQPPERDVDRSL